MGGLRLPTSRPRRAVCGRLSPLSVAARGAVQAASKRRRRRAAAGARRGAADVRLPQPLTARRDHWSAASAASAGLPGRSLRVGGGGRAPPSAGHRARVVVVVGNGTVIDRRRARAAPHRPGDKPFARPSGVADGNESTVAGVPPSRHASTSSSRRQVAFTPRRPRRPALTKRSPTAFGFNASPRSERSPRRPAAALRGRATSRHEGILARKPSVRFPKEAELPIDDGPDGAEHLALARSRPSSSSRTRRRRPRTTRWRPRAVASSNERLLGPRGCASTCEDGCANRRLRHRAAPRGADARYDRRVPTARNTRDMSATVPRAQHAADTLAFRTPSTWKFGVHTRDGPTRALSPASFNQSTTRWRTAASAAPSLGPRDHARCWKLFTTRRRPRAAHARRRGCGLLLLNDQTRTRSCRDEFLKDTSPTCFVQLTSSRSSVFAPAALRPGGGSSARVPTIRL